MVKIYREKRHDHLQAFTLVKDTSYAIIKPG